MEAWGQGLFKASQSHSDRCLSRIGDSLLLTGVKGYLRLSGRHEHPILNQGAIYGLFDLVL